MHSFFPHPNDRLIVLRVWNEPDSADIETVRGLLKGRVEERGSIKLFLDADCSVEAFAHWIAAFFDEIRIEDVERFAIVGEAMVLSCKGCETLVASERVRQFTSGQREQALTWIQTGGTT